MGEQRHGRLNRLQRDLPEALIVDAAWLERQGYSRALRSKYVKNGWLDRVARGVYRRLPAKLYTPDEDQSLRWQHAVVSFQTLLEYSFTVGGRTALELQGFAHYLTVDGPRQIHLYGDATPSGWVSKLHTEPRLVFHNARRLFTDAFVPRRLGAPSRALQSHQSANPDRLPAGLIRQQWGDRDWPLVLSTPERAILELLDEIPRHETFHQADMLMEGLRNLSPNRLQKLLAGCRSVKVKRLFLWFAERHDHAWLKRVDRQDIDLGHGKRMIVRGGKLDTKFNITVPERLDANG